MPKSADSKKRNGKQHLYQKGTSLYYRFVIPAHAKHLPAGKEIRVCLQTCLAKEARKIITQLHAFMLGELGRFAMDDNQFDSHSGASREQEMASLRKILDAKVDEILRKPEKRYLSSAEITRRLNDHLSKKLEKDMLEYSDRFEITQTDPDGTKTNISEGDIWSKIGTEKIINAQNAEGMDSSFSVFVLEMINEGVFTEEEITRENVASLIKCFRIYEGKYYQALGARRRGDFSFENTLISPVVPLPTPEQENITNKRKKLSIRFSELVTKYCHTQVQDGNWKAHMRKEHESKLNNFIEIIGDKEISAITREDMREFRDILRKLPPNRKKSTIYSTKSIEEIIASDPVKTLNIKTVNSIVEAVSTLLTWAIKERLLSDNPAIGLSLKDDTPEIEKREAFTNEDIRQIFYKGDYKPENFSNPAFYWVPLIGLYTGMRLEEICQLECNDIYVSEDQIWVIDVRQKSSVPNNNKKNQDQKCCTHNPYSF